jgi:hypothetical protein
MPLNQQLLDTRSTFLFTDCQIKSHSLGNLQLHHEFVAVAVRLRLSFYPTKVRVVQSKLTMPRLKNVDIPVKMG